jgi:hypothetical protein
MAHAEEGAGHAWTVLAYQFVQHFLKDRGAADVFLTEALVSAADQWGVPKPKDSRAWGPVIHRAARAGLIVKAGYAEDQFCSPKTVWRPA